MKLFVWLGGRMSNEWPRRMIPIAKHVAALDEFINNSRTTTTSKRLWGVVHSASRQMRIKHPPPLAYD